VNRHAPLIYLLMSLLPCALAPAARAGVIVGAPRGMSASDSAEAIREAELPPRHRSPSLEIGAGGTEGDLTGATSLAIAVAAPVGRHLGIVGRFEYSHLEQQGDAIFLAMTSWTDMSVATVAARWEEGHGDLRPYVEAGLGYGWFRSRLLFTPYAQIENVIYGQLDFTDTEGRVCQTFGLGASWHPGGMPVGIFGELRVLTFIGPDSARVIPLRAGLQLGG